MSDGTKNGGKVTIIGSSSILTFFKLYEVCTPAPCITPPRQFWFQLTRDTYYQALATDRVLGTYPVTTLPHIIIYEAALEAVPHVIARIKALGIALKSEHENMSLCVLDDDDESTAEDTAHEPAGDNANDTAEDTAEDNAHDNAEHNAEHNATEDDAKDNAEHNAKDNAANDDAEDNPDDTANEATDESASEREVIPSWDFVNRIRQRCAQVEAILRGDHSGETHAEIGELDAPMRHAFSPPHEPFQEEEGQETTTKPVTREGGLAEDHASEPTENAFAVMKRVAREYAKLRADHTELLANHARVASENAALQGLIMHKMSAFQDDPSEDAETHKATKKPRV